VQYQASYSGKPASTWGSLKVPALPLGDPKIYGGARLLCVAHD
jgi:hypothetical protein